ncbi:MAG: Thioredoxin-like protein [Acidobacteriales bacterium]|nr:Thioredoxin-like protein [Terriglobales bacterium]
MFRVRQFPTLLLIAIALLAGCDRGAHPQMVGSPAPDFTVHDSDRTVALHDFRGKVVVLNFWATWCPPCVEETPALVALHSQMKDRITILAVSLDQDQNAYNKFIKDHGIQFLTVRDAEFKSSTLYGTFGYPETYIIDSKGILRRKFIGPVDWTKPEIIEYLSNL